MITVSGLFDLEHTIAKEYLLQVDYPWQVLERIGEMICALGQGLGEDYLPSGENVWIHNQAKVDPTAHITGPCIIGANTEIRPGAFIRGNALIGDNCVVGNSTELKNCILFDGVQAPH